LTPLDPGQETLFRKKDGAGMAFMPVIPQA
jgi:hypothetical protein